MAYLSNLADIGPIPPQNSSHLSTHNGELHSAVAAWLSDNRADARNALAICRHGRVHYFVRGRPVRAGWGGKYRLIGHAALLHSCILIATCMTSPPGVAADRRPRFMGLGCYKSLGGILQTACPCMWA